MHQFIHTHNLPCAWIFASLEFHRPGSSRIQMPPPHLHGSSQCRPHTLPSAQPQPQPHPSPSPSPDPSPNIMLTGHTLPTQPPLPASSYLDPFGSTCIYRVHIIRFGSHSVSSILVINTLVQIQNQLVRTFLFGEPTYVFHAFSLLVTNVSDICVLCFYILGTCIYLSIRPAEAG